MTLRTVNGETKVNLSLRDWAVFFVTVLGVACSGVLYLEKRLGGIEAKNERQDERIAANHEDTTVVANRAAKLSEDTGRIQLDIAVLKAQAGH